MGVALLQAPFCGAKHCVGAVVTGISENCLFDRYSCCNMHFPFTILCRWQRCANCSHPVSHNMYLLHPGAGESIAVCFSCCFPSLLSTEEERDCRRQARLL